MSLKCTIIGSDKGLSPVRRQVIIETNDDFSSVLSKITDFNKISIKTNQFTRTKLHLSFVSVILSRGDITVTSNDCHGVSIYRTIECFFSLTAKKHQRFALLSLCERNQPMTGGFLAQRDSNADNVSILWRHNGRWVPPAHLHSLHNGPRSQAGKHRNNPLLCFGTGHHVCNCEHSSYTHRCLETKSYNYTTTFLGNHKTRMPV